MQKVVCGYIYSKVSHANPPASEEASLKELPKTVAASERNYLLGVGRKKPGDVNWSFSEEGRAAIDEALELEKASLLERHGQDWWKKNQLAVRNRIRREQFEQLNASEKKTWNAQTGLPDMTDRNNV